MSFDTTIDGAGLLRGDLTPECAAMVRAVLDALSAPDGGGDLRTRPQRYHDALAEPGTTCAVAMPHSPGDPNAIRYPLKADSQSGPIPLTSGNPLRAY